MGSANVAVRSAARAPPFLSSSEDQYGSFMFWRMRSRITFKSSLQEAADQWMEANGFADPRRALGVRIPRGAAFERKCTTRGQRCARFGHLQPN